MAVVYGSHSKSYGYASKYLPLNLSRPAAPVTRATASPTLETSGTVKISPAPFAQPEQPESGLRTSQSIAKLESFLLEASTDFTTAETGLILPGIRPDMVWGLKGYIDSASLDGIFSIAKRLK